ncbi:hypothetical protein GCM10010833_08610 [Blastomonas aquatica]|uniref:Uncharacterized protein n=1 Tax=Blastomonas aquatica TaxID=1510276 RepID=A0ABQ1IZG0_9SPHN|nr:hypothetical protein [Blastomonas aquatica]GGB56174.1 hypothetical protein GCM10010833_08610 [Blastomonas aquatica]
MLVLAAMGSTQLLPGASAQDAQDPRDTNSVAAEPDQASDRSLAVSSDQAMAKDRSLDVPAVSNERPDTRGITGANQVPVQLGRPSVSNQLTSAGQDRGQLAPQRLEGNDACDDAPDGSGPDVCANPLETRAGEFAGRGRPQLSAEQRLLAQQFSTSATGDTTDATARRLAAGRSADLSNEDLAIAATVTADQGGRQPPASETGTDIPADATNAIDVILGVINAAVPE